MSSPRPRRHTWAGRSTAWNGSGAGCSSGSHAEAGRDVELLTRRASLLRFGGLVVALATGGWKVHSSEGADAVACVLTPEQTEGPYYVCLFGRSDDVPRRVEMLPRCGVVRHRELLRLRFD